jgi:methylthioribose-1-phosphate isomerase
MIETVRWHDGVVRMLDQTRLPAEEVYLELDDVEPVHEAIRALRVRGAPAIGIAAAYGVALMAWKARGDARAERRSALAAAERLRTARPTAVNLFWALDRMLDALERVPEGASPAEALVAEADRILEEDLEASRAMGAHGADLLPKGARILTHCNTGGLATGGLGTALGVVYAAKDRGLEPTVFADETRPLLQGARLTAWECRRAGIPVRLLVDGAAAWALRTQSIDAVIIGSDRIAANGDVANKIGSYQVALAARAAGVPFYVVAPGTTIDAGTPDGEAIEIEERGADEVRAFGASPTAPEGVEVFNPAFDVTPAELVSAIVTEAGVFRPPYDGLAGAAAPRRAFGA